MTELNSNKIELIKDKNKGNTCNSHIDNWDYVNIPCHIYDDDIHNLAVLKELLEKVGITMSAERRESSDFLSFEIDYETFENIMNRGAGRKKDFSMSKRYKECTVSELKTKLETMKKCEIIEELGCPKTTFYRILKNINWNDNNSSIWLYTS